jgi:Fic family protein
MVEDYRQRLDASWIYHDSALEGVVYTMEELSAALLDQPVSDSSMIPMYDEIRQHMAAVGLIREMAEKNRLKVSLEVVKKIYAQLAPEELEGKGGPRYRKDMPLHRLYFHDISPPDKVSYRMRQLIQWMNAADTRRSTHAVRLAAKAHYHMLHIYPFPKHSGKVARLVMNLILLRNGYPPAVIHATERQRYYEALKSSENAAAAIVHEALVASVESAIRFFEGETTSSGEIKSA